MKKTLILGSSSEISKWIASGLDLVGKKYILVSRDITYANYSISDYSNIEELTDLFNTIYSQDVYVDSIYFCPGTYTHSEIKDSEPHKWINDINVNLNSAYILYRALTSTQLINNQIKLIYIGSTASVSKPQKFSSYAISKGALEDLITYINNEKPAGIRSTCLRLGTCQTLFASSGSHESKNILVKEDIINCVRFLESSRHGVLPDLISMRPIQEN